MTGIMPSEGELQELTGREGQTWKWGKMQNLEAGKREGMCAAGLLDAE